MLNKKTFAIFLILLSASQLPAQIQPFRGLDFSKENYHLMCVHRGSAISNNPLGEWISKDTNLLKEFQKQLVFNHDQEEEMDLGYRATYQVILYENDSAIKHFYVFPGVHQIKINDRYYPFNYSYSLRTNYLLTKISRKVESFKSLESARKNLDFISKNDSTVYIYRPDWEKYEGHFYLRNYILEGPRHSTRAYPDSVKKYILNKYGKYNFDVKTSSTSSSMVFMKVNANKELYDLLKHDRLLWGSRYYRDSSFTNSFEFVYRTELFGFHFPKIKEVGDSILSQLKTEFDSVYSEYPHQLDYSGFGGGTSLDSPFRFIYTLKSNDNLFDSFSLYEGLCIWREFNLQLMYYSID